jgi:hypothetical protein
MDRPAPSTRRPAARSLIGVLAALCLALPALAGHAPDEKTDAAKVAKKVDKARSAAHQAEDEREALRHFQKEVADYARLHSKQIARVGAREAATTEAALAQAIAASRAKAQPGDVFDPEIQPLFRRLIAEQLQGPDALAARKAVLEGNPSDDPSEPAVPVVVRVNAVYPPGAARSTVPPSLLLTLPPLPPCLHYRFVGRDLVLVDTLAQLIVDFLPAAAPELRVK